MGFSFLFVQLAVWLGFAFLTRFTWLDTHPPSWGWIASYMGLGFLFSSLMRPILLGLNHRTLLFQVGGILSAALFLGLMWRLAFNSLEYHVLQSNNNAFKFWGYFHNGKSSVVQLLAWSFGFWGLQHYRQSFQAKQTAVEARALAQETKLRLLQYQIRPHFFFNTLSSLDTLLLTSRVQEARDLLSQLVRFFRFSIEVAVEDIEGVPLHQELAWIQAYLAIEKQRFGNRLQLKRQIQGKPDVIVPAGILMPIVENAMKHGIHPSVNGGTLTLSVAEETYDTVVTIGNSSAPDQVNREKGSSSPDALGLGLKNTAARMEHFYGDSNRFVTEQTEGEYIARFRFRKPQNKENPK